MYAYPAIYRPITTVTVKVPAGSPNNPMGFTITKTPYTPNQPITWPGKLVYNN